MGFFNSTDFSEQARSGIESARRQEEVRAKAIAKPKDADYDDSDLARSRELSYQFGHYGEAGAQMDMLQARSKQRRGLTSAIETLPQMLAKARGDLFSEANQALDTGLKKTRDNYSKRGLLYGGMREGGEQSLRGKVATGLASNVSSQNKEFGNLKNSYETARAGLALSGAQQNIDRASQVFDQAMRNNISRLQAMQSLGQGVGYAAGAYYGKGGDAPSQEISSNYSNRNTAFMTNEAP